MSTIKPLNTNEYRWKLDEIQTSVRSIFDNSSSIDSTLIGQIFNQLEMFEIKEIQGYIDDFKYEFYKYSSDAISKPYDKHSVEIEDNILALIDLMKQSIK